MKHSFPSTIVQNPDQFKIECESAVTVRIDDKRAKLYKQVRIERKRDPVVIVTVRDFAGAEFKVQVSLLSGGAALIYPDFSGWDDGKLVVCQAVKLIEEILAEVSN